MRELGLAEVPKKHPLIKTTRSNHRLPNCENILNRDFDEIYLATMIDLRTRKMI